MPSSKQQFWSLPATYLHKQNLLGWRHILPQRPKSSAHDPTHHRSAHNFIVLTARLRAGPCYERMIHGIRPKEFVARSDISDPYGPGSR